MKVMRRRNISLCMVMVMLVSGLAGCNAAKGATNSNSENSQVTEGSSIPTGESSVASETVSTSTSSISGQSQAVSPTPGTAGKVEIVVWDNQNNEALTLAAVDYESKNKNVKVTIKQQGKTTVTALKMAIAAQTAPDVVCMDQVYVAASGSLGYLKDINQYGADKVKSSFIDSCVQSVTYNNKFYGLPFDANTIALLYNKDVFDQVGATVPSTYANFLDVSNKIKAKFGTSTYAYTSPFDGWPDKNWMAFNYFFWLWRMGGNILSTDLKTATFNSQAGIDALQMLVSMKNDGLASPTYKHDEFFAGKVGMIEIGPWTFVNAFGANKKANFGVALLPVLKTGVLPYSGLGLYCYSVTSSSKVPQEAYNFIEFFCTNAKYQLQYCKKNNLIPSLKSAHSDSFYTTPEWKVMIQQLGYSKFRPGVPNWDRMEETIADAVTLAVQGQKSPKEALDAAATNVNRLLANNR